MITPEEMIDLMENIGYDAAILPEKSLQVFDPSEEALPILAPVTVNWPSEENSYRFECRVWFDCEEIHVAPEILNDFVNRYNWGHGPWKLLFNVDEMDFCFQIVWPTGDEFINADIFFEELLSGCCLVHCAYAAMLALADDVSVDNALINFDEEFEMLAKLIEEEVADDSPSGPVAEIAKGLKGNKSKKPSSKDDQNKQTQPQPKGLPMKKAPAKKAAPTKKPAPKPAPVKAPAKKVVPAKASAKVAPAKAPVKKDSAKKPAPAKKAMPAKKPAPKAAPVKAPVKKAAPAKKVAVSKKTAPAKAPAKKATPAKKPAPKAPVKAPVKKAAPAKKVAVAKKPAPVKAPAAKAPVKKAAPVKAPVKKAAPAKKAPAKKIVKGKK